MGRSHWLCEQQEKVIKNKSSHTITTPIPLKNFQIHLCPILGNHFYTDVVNVDETPVCLPDTFHKKLCSAGELSKLKIKSDQIEFILQRDCSWVNWRFFSFNTYPCVSRSRYNHYSYRPNSSPVVIKCRALKRKPVIIHESSVYYVL